MRESNKTTQANIAHQFVDELRLLINAKSPLHIAMSDYAVFSFDKKLYKIVSDSNWLKEIKDVLKYDLIIGDLPLGMNREDYETKNGPIKMRKNWIQILKALSFLKDEGLSVFLVEPMAFGSNDGKRFEDELSSEGYSVISIINAPVKLLYPQTSITPVFVVIKKTPIDKILVAELFSDGQARELAKKIVGKNGGGDLASGIPIAPRTFNGFDRFKAKQQIEKLETQYKEFDQYSIKDLALEINDVRSPDTIKEKENSVYIPKIGNSSVVARLTEAKLKHHNYFQVVLNNKVINDYLVSLFRSDLGRLILNSLTSGSYIARLNKHDLEQMSVAVPPIYIQNAIINTHHKLSLLHAAIDRFDSELALNPTSSSIIMNRLDDMLKAIEGLSDSDKVKSIVRNGETLWTEFKETLSYDIKKKTKEKYIETSALKTIVAFLNTEGGTLLIGVNDKGEFTGLSFEIETLHKNLDKFLLHFKNLIKEKIGEEYYPYIRYRIIEVDQMPILKVDCTESQSPCYLDQSEFYVRTNPATDKLEGHKLVEYVKNHFK